MIACAVPFCRRSRKGERAAAWLCGEHWRGVPRDTKRCMSQARTRADLAFWWAFCVADAIEAAAGIGPTPGLIPESAMAAIA